MQHMSMPLTLKARSYQAMHVFDNHIHIISVEEHLTTFNNGVAIIFEQQCRSKLNDQRFILAKLEYVGWVEEILELNYGILKTIV